MFALCNAFLRFHSEDTGVWNEEKESSLFVVPSCHYGYVDCKWYLDIRLSDMTGSKVSGPHRYGMKNRQVMVGVRPLPEYEAASKASACIDFPALAYAALMGFDSLDTAARHQPLVSAEVSVEQSPSDSYNPNEICDLLHLFKKGMPLHERQGSLQLDGRTSAAANIRETSTKTSPKKGVKVLVEQKTPRTPPGGCALLGRPAQVNENSSPKAQMGLAYRKKTNGVAAYDIFVLRRITKGRKADSATVAAESARSMAFMFSELLESCYMMAKGRVLTEATKIPQGAELNFVLGSHLVLPLFSVATTVHLRRVPELAILITAFGSAILTVVTLTFLGWDFRVMGFFMLGRTLYALFVIMVAR
ncbi:hypothetical protein EPH_0062040 [Eimeria praecox]|uniref:Uncharacterized protein n=1 Tax=Eimeria praecox TaxID=51316 RepID=U6H5S9_9EIME|nr:hypothetical protein EPH_0062040 [Eimeria praecox]